MNTNLWPGQQNGQTSAGLWPGQPQQPQQPQQPAWPGQPQQPAWPGQPQQPAWPGQPEQPAWPSQPQQPAWPSQPEQPAWPSQPQQPQNPGRPSNPPTALKVPYDMKLPNGVYNKMLITIRGQVKPNPNKFTVDLTAGKEIAFHLKPYFNEHGKKQIVRNSLLEGKWGKEEKELNNFPFAAGKAFELKIFCTSSEFKVAVNGTHLLEFKHRFSDLRQIKQLSIYNDVTLTYVNVESLP